MSHMQPNPNESNEDDVYDNSMVETPTDPITPQIINTSDYFRRYFKKLSGQYPPFFDGSLDQALQASLECRKADRRPLLIYVHNEKALYTGIFCSRFLCHEETISSLIEHYTLWMWNHTSHNQAVLCTLWKQIFGTSLVNHLSETNFPLLIGVKHEIAQIDQWFATPKYQYEFLVKGNQLPRDHQTITLQPFLDELKTFRLSFDKIEQKLPFSIQEIPQSYWDVFVEICKYGTLNDAVDIFSPNILLKIKDKPNFPLHLSNRPAWFISQVKNVIDLDRTQSLRIHFSELASIFDLREFQNFRNAVSLHLYDMQTVSQIEHILLELISVQRLSLWFSGEMDFQTILLHFLRLPSRITHLRIHCAGVACVHNRNETDFPVQVIESITSVKYFLVNLDYYPIINTDQCQQRLATCFLQQMANFVQQMTHIELIRFRLSSYHVEKVFDRDIWRNLIKRCEALNKIYFNILKESEVENLTERIVELERDLQNIRSTVIVRFFFEQI